MLWPSTAKRVADAVMMKSGAILEEGYVYEEETHLTVLKTSLFFAGDGFTVYDCKGELVFRVDSYGPDAGDTGEVVLMDASGRCILTVRRKRPSLHQRWEGYNGEGTEGKKPLFSVRRSSIIGRSNMTVEVYTNPGEEYQIEGSFGCRNCNIFNAEKEIVAEIRRKVDATTNVVLGKDVFLLSLKPGFDGAFAMGLVLILDQIHGADDDGGGENGSKVGVDPTETGRTATPRPRPQVPNSATRPSLPQTLTPSRRLATASPPSAAVPPPQPSPETLATGPQPSPVAAAPIDFIAVITHHHTISRIRAPSASFMDRISAFLYKSKAN